MWVTDVVRCLSVKFEFGFGEIFEECLIFFGDADEFIVLAGEILHFVLEFLQLKVNSLNDLDFDEFLKLEFVIRANEQDDFDVGLLEAVSLVRFEAVFEFDNRGVL